MENYYENFSIKEFLLVLISVKSYATENLNCPTSFEPGRIIMVCQMENLRKRLLLLSKR